MEAQRKFISKIDGVVNINFSRIYDAAQDITENMTILKNLFKSKAYQNKLEDNKISFSNFISDVEVAFNKADYILIRINQGYDYLDINSYATDDNKAIKELEDEKLKAEAIVRVLNGTGVSRVADLYKSTRVDKAINSSKESGKKLVSLLTQSINVIKRDRASKRK